MNDLDFLVKEIGKQKHIINTGVESTDLALMVDAPSREESHPWDMTRIVNALVTEAGVDPNTAMSIAAEVEEEILRPWRTRVTTSLIREMVNVKLFQRGLDARIADHSRIGIPLYDLELVMRAPNKENSNTSHNPESINLTIAETVLKEYALTKVFSPDVARAHLNGDFH
ncbi:MAG: anaerobic ribonucleoside-triphosphate reductase, partial [Synergistales bacterium]|nr:anaerobic ribonucleoside-triphosphate reductase [Synergistales bacterium]